MNAEHCYQAIVKPPMKGIKVRLGIKMCEAGKLVRVDFLDDTYPQQVAQLPYVQKVCDQLWAYFDDPDFKFEIPLSRGGTAYQKRVWQKLQTIGAGNTLSYGELAQQIDSGARAVANACRQNPFPILIPCHRVVAKTGIGGYSGETIGAKLDFKYWLLKHEAKSHIGLSHAV